MQDLKTLFATVRTGGFREYIIFGLIPIFFLAMGSGLLAAIACFLIIPIIIAINLGISRDRSGWMWGLFLGWLGVLILACMRPVKEEA